MKLRKPDPALMSKSKQTQSNQRAKNAFVPDWRSKNRNTATQRKQPKQL